MKKVLAVVALMGVASSASVVQAAPAAATLLKVTSYSPNGAAGWNRTNDTSTWTFDTAAPAAAAAMTGGSYSALTKAGATPLMRHTMTGVTLGSGPAIGTTWTCIEGTFGGGGSNTGGVGASICGNYNFGANQTNESTYTPTVTGATVTLGGEDGAIGPAQTLVTSYSTMLNTALAGAPVGFQRYCLSNSTFNGGPVADPARKCGAIDLNTPQNVNGGYDFVFEVTLVPDANDDLFATFRNTPIALPILANDVYFSDPVTVALFSLPAHGTALVSGSSGPQSGVRITYTPTPGFIGTDTFQYAVDDGMSADIATVMVTVSVPDAVDDTVSIDAQTPAVINALGNDGGFADPIAVTITIDPDHGGVVVNGSPGNKAGINFTYTPATGFTGTDTFDYAIDDGVNADNATVTVTVRPTALPDSVPTDRNTAVMIPVLANDVGFGNPVTVTLPSSPAHGTALVNGSPGPQGGVSITYTPTASYTGLDTFTYQVSDGVAQSTTTVTVRVKPEANNDQAVVLKNLPKAIAVLNNDVGFTDPVTVAIFSVPAHGTVAVNNSPGNQAAVTITYTPALDYQGPDSFAYTVADGSSLGIATVGVTVTQDSDGDGDYDNQDNCRTIANPDQRDTNGDGFGNLCDADLDNSGFVNFNDLVIFKQRFTTTDPDANLDGVGLVNFADLAIFKSLFGKPPGPSGTAP